MSCGCECHGPGNPTEHRTENCPGCREKMDAQSATIDATSELIETLGKESLFPCDRKTEGKHDEVACLNLGKIEWGRPLTAKEYSFLCPACRAYWHVSAARNDLIEFVRTR